VLILIYAVVILGGTGSLTGMIVGAIVIIASNQVLDSTSPPNVARVLFYLALIAAVYFTMRGSWVRLVAAFVGTVVFGLVVHAIVDAVWSRGTAGQVTSGGFLTGLIRNWVLLPTNPGRLAVYGYLLMIVCIIALVQLKGWWRLVVLVPTLYLTAFVWENLLVQQPAVTRYVLFGALLIAVMTIRPQGLFGTAKVEIG